MTAAGTGLALGLSLTALFLPPLPCAGAPSRSSKKPPSRVAPAPAPPREPESPITRLREQIKALMADMRVSAEKLQTLQKRYPENKDLDALLPERRAALQEIEERWAELERMEEDFKRMLKIEQAQTVTALLQRFQTGTMPKDESSAPQAEVERLMGIDSFNRVIKEFKTEIGNIRGQENGAWNAERQAIADEKRRIAIACGGAGAFLALILFVRYVRKRRRLATVTVTSVAPAPYPTGAPGLPGQAPGLLPGPSTPAPYAAAGAEAIGTVIGGNYKILSELGRGGLGIVFEAQDVTLERKVALRKIREEVHQSEKDIESFLAQARFVAALKHANLTEIYSIFLESERIFMVVEHFPGQPLSRFLDSGNRISLRSVKGVLQQVCAALDYAHANSVLHGDLKPSNIMVNPQGLVKVMDFGIGLQAKKILAKHGWSETRVSPAYMAPEQELGFAAKASDLYSLGICFYELATGRLPFEGPNFLAQKREMRFPPPTQIVPELPKGADLVAQRALQPEPGNRFRSAAEFFSTVAALPG